ncbi:hypothetical protein [Salinicola tamaricis]|uniref:hypothetical protein n=1 Tax=Salinicola tamaricis TaxID=1771309 RepID=UPI00101AE131|nr:hypothetical protein [Salinicola tamaricis]
MTSHRWSKVVALCLPLLSACHASPQGASSDHLIFVGQDSTYNVTPDCTENLEQRESEGGSPYLTFDFVSSSACFDQFDSWINRQIGKQVHLEFDGVPVTPPSKVFSAIGPANVRIVSDDRVMLQRVYHDLSQ